MSRARVLADRANQNALAVDTSSNEVGIASTVPSSTLDVRGEVKVGTAVQLGSAGVITATSFSGSGESLTGVVGVGTLNVRTESLTVSGASTFTGGSAKISVLTDSTSATTGALIVDGGVGIAKNVYIGAGLSVAGTLTYEDVTSVDSVGLITAKSGVNVSGGQLQVGVAYSVGAAGVATALGLVAGTSGLTVSGATSGTTGDFSSNLTVGSGITMGSAGVATFSGTADIHLLDSVQLNVGDASDLNIRHDGSNSKISHTGAGGLYIGADLFGLETGNHGERFILATANSSVEVNYDNSKKWETTNDGTVTTGISTATTGFTARNDGSSNIDLKLVSGTTWGLRSQKTSGENSYGFEIYKGSAGTDRKLTITSDGEILQGISTSRGNFGNNASGVDYIRQIEGTGATGSSIALVRNSADANDGGIIIGKTRSATVLGNTVVQAGDDLGTITWAGSDGTSLQFGAEITSTVETGVGNDDMPASLIFKTNSGTTSTSERLRINSRGGFQFNNAELVERCNITAGKLSDNVNIPLSDGMVHYFTTQETTTCTPNIRVDSSNTLNAAMDAGDVITVTLITTAAAGGYHTNITIDGNAVTEEWVGGSAPSAGGSNGLDIYVYTIICTHATNTGDSGFKVIANLTNAT